MTEPTSQTKDGKPDGSKTFLAKIPDSTLFSTEKWLGPSPQDLVDSRDYQKLWQRLLSWQARIGIYGDPVSPKLRQDLEASLQLSLPDPTEGQLLSALDLLRAQVHATLIPVDRAYLLNTKWTLTKTSTLVTSFDTTCWDLFIDSARHHAYELGLPLWYEFVRPRFVDGIAGIKVTGNAHELQDFVNRCFGAIGIHLSSLDNQPYMRPIPSFQSASRLRQGLVVVPEADLRPECKSIHFFDAHKARPEHQAQAAKLADYKRRLDDLATA